MSRGLVSNKAFSFFGGGGEGGLEALGMIFGGKGRVIFASIPPFCLSRVSSTPQADKGDVVYIDALFVLNILIKIFTTTGVPFRYTPLA